MYLDKNEFELAKEYCRVRFDCKLSSLIDMFHLVDVSVIVYQRIQSFIKAFSAFVHMFKKLLDNVYFMKKNKGYFYFVFISKKIHA